MKTLILICSLALLGGCATDTIQVDAIDQPIQTVSARHDAYVKADATLSDAQKATALRTTELLRAVIEAAKADK